MTPLDSLLAGAGSVEDWAAVVGLGWLILLGLGAIAWGLVANARARHDALARGECPEDLP